MQYFTHNRHNTFTMHVPNFMIVEFVSLIMSQFTTNAQNILQLNQCTRVHV
jgi:hypothetical protein